MRVNDSRAAGVDGPPQLRRVLSFWQVTASGVGIVIGAGIYVLIGAATREAGSAVWAAFIIAGALSALSALSYAELAGMYPSAGAEYSFAKEAFNEFIGFVTGWMMVVALLMAGGTVSIGFAHYLQYFYDIDTRVAAFGLLALVTIVILSGIQRSIWLTVALAGLQIGGLLLVVASGVGSLGDHSLTEGATIGGVLSGAALVFFAFIGFDEVVTLSEETRDPTRTIPRALLAALAISTLLYVLVAIASISVVGPLELGASDRPLALVMEENWGERASGIVAAIAVAATMNTTLMALTAASRNLYGMARGGSLPAQLGSLSRRTGAPWMAALIGVGIAAIFASFGDIDLAASVTDFAVYGIFIVVNLSVIRLRRTQPDAPRSITVPLSFGGWPILPMLAIATVALMVVRLEPLAWVIGGFANLCAVATWWIVRVTGAAATKEGSAAGVSEGDRL